jgi:hypothetical protein
VLWDAINNSDAILNPLVVSLKADNVKFKKMYEDAIEL